MDSSGICTRMTDRKYYSTITGISIMYRLILLAGGWAGWACECVAVAAEWGIAYLLFYLSIYLSICLFVCFLRRHATLRSARSSLSSLSSKPTVSHRRTVRRRYFVTFVMWTVPMLVSEPTVGTGCSAGDCRRGKLFPIEHSVSGSETGAVHTLRHS